ncbi:MAG: 3-methyl-2-oxobutanoate hydroxymethyltransferase [bacterium]|nr:3-methyl-2-oxobutanoate hydroxymethyltransferase [bacterium]MCP4799781.1 3-methyl-2-oxobutanoate hydroxymethyltransferase [bacterium]
MASPKTLTLFNSLKAKGQPIVMLTAYDLTSALIADEGGVDAILVGDSVGMVVLGYENTLPVTTDDILHHCRAVSRARPNVPVIADMPYGSFHVSAEDTVRHALSFIKEGNATAVKVEGGRKRAPVIRALVDAEIPVMGHLGLTPQSVNKLGGYKVQGKTQEQANKIIDEARFLEEAGCFAIILECIPEELAKQISSELSIPTIGIGAGVGCDGQVLVFHDLLGLFDKIRPKFVKRYAELRKLSVDAVSEYCAEVRTRAFPADEHTFHGKRAEPEQTVHVEEEKTPEGYLADLENGDKS